MFEPTKIWLVKPNHFLSANSMTYEFPPEPASREILHTRFSQTLLGLNLSKFEITTESQKSRTIPRVSQLCDTAL